MIKLRQRSYTNGQVFRPKPIIIERAESHLLVIATPWGPLECAQRAAEIIVEQFELLSGEDVTSTFDSLPTLSAPANRLRKGVLMANQYLYKTENAKILKAAVEVVAIHYDHGVLSWAHVGGPHLILNDGKNIHPVAYDADWSCQSDNQGPLFAQALGMENNVPIHLGSLRMAADTQALVISRSTLPSSVFGSNNFDLDSVLDKLVLDDAEAPCWVGVVELEESTQIEDESQAQDFNEDVA